MAASSDNTVGNWGSTERAALVWFIATLIIGSALTVVLAGIDKRFYQSEGVYLNNRKYFKNRYAATSLRSSDIDDRAQGGIGAVRLDTKMNKH